MATTVDKPGTSALERNWWLRAPAVLVAPRAVFASLRDDSDEAADERGQPIVTLIWFAGMAAVLATPTARSLLNQGGSPVVVAIWAFLAGGVYSLITYFAGGGLLFGSARRLGSLGSYRRARHLLALASAPIALTLVTVWPVRYAIYGEWLFHTGGDDWGPGDRIFGGLIYASFVWSGLLLVLGVRFVHGWGWGRSLATAGLAASLPILLVLATHVASF
ncbi:MAG TPA: YIP1 family protein [Gaiellaceae bacterium]|jgi:hypothetical protein